MAAARTLTSTQLSLRGRIAAFTRASRYDGSTVTANARSAFLASFLAEVDAANPGLNDEERQRRAQALRRAHMSRLAFASARARTRQPETQNAQPLRSGRAPEEGADVAAPSVE